MAPLAALAARALLADTVQPGARAALETADTAQAAAQVPGVAAR
jgi:hypothetical protein